MLSVAIFLFVCLFYARCINYDLVCDDLTLKYTSPEKPKSIVTTIIKEIYGLGLWSAKRAHCLAIIIHAINAVLVYHVGGRTFPSTLAALFFAVNPTLYQCTVIPFGKPYSLTAMMLLIGLLIPGMFPVFNYIATMFSPAALLSSLTFLHHGMVPRVAISCPILVYRY